MARPKGIGKHTARSTRTRVTAMRFYSRKSPRLCGYDYAEQNYYFITICTHNKECIFGNPGILNHLGQVVQKHIEKIPVVYANVLIDKFVIMPNHIHVIIALDGEKTPSVSRIVGQFKMAVTKEIKQNYGIHTIWQRSFHDHVIRNQKDYERIWLYIHGNPQKWSDDCFFVEDW